MEAGVRVSEPRLGPAAPCDKLWQGPLPSAWAPSPHGQAALLCCVRGLRTWGQGITPLVGAGHGAGALVQPLRARASPGRVAGRVGGTWGRGGGRGKGQTGKGGCGGVHRPS